MNILILCCVFLSSCFGYADWNKDFDRGTLKLLDCFTEAKEEYVQQYALFQEIRDRYIKDLFLKNILSSMSTIDKEIIIQPIDNIVIKKRRADHIYEAFAWEISTLFGSSSCIVPSFPAKIGGKLVILQNIEDFSIREKGTLFPSKKVLKSVSLDAYWIAHVQAYLLGMGDLVARNVGVNSRGKIRFFDVECSFSYRNKTHVHEDGFYTGFVADSFAWPQFTKPLDHKGVYAVRAFIHSLSHIEEQMEVYLALRPLPLDKEGFLYRLNKIRNFPLQEGKSFEDFYRFLFPNLGEGMEELVQIVSHILHRKVPSGEAVVWSRKGVKKYNLSEKERKPMQEWISTYLEQDGHQPRL